MCYLWIDIRRGHSLIQYSLSAFESDEIKRTKLKWNLASSHVREREKKNDINNERYIEKDILSLFFKN